MYGRTAVRLVSFVAVFLGMSRKAPTKALRDIPKNGCEGDYCPVGCTFLCKILTFLNGSMGPDALGKFLFILRKNLSPVALDNCARWILDLPNFPGCQSLTNFKDAVVLPPRRTNFCQAWNLTDLLIYTSCFEGKCQSKKFDLNF